MFQLLFKKALWNAVGTIWRTVLQLLTLGAGVAALLSIMAVAGVIDTNPITVIWEAPADLARTLAFLVEMGDRIEGMNIEQFLESATRAADLYVENNPLP